MSLVQFLSLDSAASWVPVADIVVKATLMFAAAGAAAFVLRRGSAAVRHMIWTLALGGVLLLPVLSIALPRWQMKLVTFESAASVSSSQLPVSSAQPAFAQKPCEGCPAEAALAAKADRIPDPGSRLRQPSSASRESRAASRESASWSTILLTVWLTGALLILARLAAGIVAVRWMSRRTERVTDAPWLEQARALAESLGVSPRLVFLRSEGATMPMAWGILRPAVLMPSEADEWPAERLRIVLLHELAHVKRRDCLTHMLAQISCALHWFNPLAWMAARHVRTERERACDDLVLAAGTRGPEYADQLIEIARVMRSGRFPAVLAGASLAMAHRSELEGRLLAILDPSVPRAGLSRVRTLGATSAFALAVMPLASLQPWTIVSTQDQPAAEIQQSTTSAQQPTPSPTPTPSPSPSPSDSERRGRRGIEPSAHDAAVESAIQSAVQSGIQSGVQSRVQSNVQSQIQSNVQSPIQSNVQGHVQSAVQSGIQSGVQAGVQYGVAGAMAGMHAATGHFDFEPLNAALNAGLQAAGQQPAQGPQGPQAPQGARQSKADPRTVAALTAALKDTDKDVRETAMHALVQLRDPSIFDPLVQALSDGSPDVREQAAFGLGQLRDRRAVEPLIKALKDPNGDVREQAAFALGQIRDHSAVAGLSAAVKDPDDDVREQAVFALGQIRDPGSVDALIGAIHDTKPDVRQQVVFSLGQIRDRRAVEPLISALKDSAPDVREQAAFALGQIRDPRAVEALVIALKDSASDVREQAAFALGQIRDPRAIDGLTAALKDPSADVRQQAAFALGQLAR
jgi:HEAT repeat protein/beta-lactamase regulating signal transducer with metallopeptidase domain